MVNIDELKFDEKGLIPAVVVDSISKKVLTVAYMNKESLEISMQKGLTCFYSRSRDELWLKGETSGNYQHIVSITADCDNDALVVVVEKDGPACHTGTDSCFTNTVWQSPDLHEFSMQGLYDLLQGRKEQRPEGSYTTYLFDKGIDKILKKVLFIPWLLLRAKPMIKKKQFMKLPIWLIIQWCLWCKWASLSRIFTAKLQAVI